MPRKTKGSGGNYPNRTDLIQPVRTGTGMAYGQAQELQQSQQAAPLPQIEDPMAGMRAALQAAQQHPFQPVSLNAPSSRPNEPVTAGLASGPGPGPAALGTDTGLSALLERAAMESGNETIRAMLDQARRLGL